MDGSPQGSSVHGILQTRILEWVAVPWFRASSWPGIEPTSPTSLLNCRQLIYCWATVEAHMSICLSFKKRKRGKKKIIGEGAFLPIPSWGLPSTTHFLASPPGELSAPKGQALGVKRYELMADITSSTFSFLLGPRRPCRLSLMQAHHCWGLWESGNPTIQTWAMGSEGNSHRSCLSHIWGEVFQNSMFRYLCNY